MRGAQLDCERAVDDRQEFWAPLAAAGARADEPVRVVLSSSVASLEHLCRPERVEFHGVVRDLWWEGLGDHERKALAEHRVTLAPDARLLDADRPIDVVMWTAVVGFTAVLGAIFTLFTWLRQRRARG